MSSQVAGTCLPTLLVNGTGAGWNKDSGPQGFVDNRTEGFEQLFLQIPFLKTPVCVSGIFFSLATKSLIVRSFIFGIDLKTRSPHEIRLLCAPREGLARLSKWDVEKGPVAAQFCKTLPCLHNRIWVPHTFLLSFSLEWGRGNITFLFRWGTAGPRN